MPNKQTKQSTATVKAVKPSQLKVIELVRRQGIYTGTLQIDDVKEVESLLESFEERKSTIAKKGPKVTEIEFKAKGGRSGQRDYCLRLPNITIEELEKIGFSKSDIESLYTKS